MGCYQQAYWSQYGTDALTNVCGCDVHCLKNVALLICYNLYIHGLITTIFGKNVAEKVSNKNVLYFPTSPKCCFCTTWATGNPESAFFHLNAACFTKKTQNTVKNITSSELNNSSVSK